MDTVTLRPMSEEDALALIVKAIKHPKRPDPMRNPTYGADLYLPNVITDQLDVQRRQAEAGQERRGMRTYSLDPIPNSRPFYNAAHALCLRGVLAPAPTPGRVLAHTQGVVMGGGFNVTEYGRRWLEELSEYDVLPVEYGRFAQLLASHSERFGQAYHARSQEAARCYQAHTYLACCVMCGAAAESILLGLAIERSGDEERVLKDYATSGGRGKIERLLLGQQKQSVKDRFDNYMELLKYWRDSAAHGGESTVDEEEAFTSILLLLRFAQFADSNWAALTTVAG